MSITQDPPFRDGADQAPDPDWTVPGLGIPTQRTSPENPPDPAGDADAPPAAEADPGLGPGVEDLADSGTETPGHPVVVAVATCLEALDGIKTTSAVGLNAKEIRLMLLAVVHLTAALFALKMRLLVAGEVHRVHDLTGATSLPAFLAHLTQTPRADASAQVRLARDLDRRWPLLADALATGRINPDQTKIAVTALRKLPKNLTAEQNTAVQHCLIQAAQTMTGRQLKAVGRHLWDVIDPDGADKRAGKDLEDEEERARARAYFTSWRNGDGTTGFRGKLPDAQADMLLKALTALASPRRRTNPHIPTTQPDHTRPNDTRSDDHGNRAHGDSDDTGHGAGHSSQSHHNGHGAGLGNDDTGHGSQGHHNGHG
ncbi:MAG: 13E12 repeat family protein, partial [Actinomycetes bacterium]|nr:13E12 repeat family protein [Actinomycetes bacterium]MDX5380190.1 13E12 repeat family protein [Actinomycetes bacterium]MDX5398856.1 13E12 repeat family protein [Actinomycetes bacterium]MDX5449912.1 13E12 repeat family protein [Actinomycetes bacterium]